MIRYLVALVVVAVVAGCQRGPHAPSPIRQLDAFSLAGEWRWLLRTDEAGTSRIEREDWHLAPNPKAPAQLIGRYVRTVEVRSLDREPFRCNERLWYRQRAVYDVTVTPRDADYTITETAYQTEPSPCDHGFRHLGSYTASRNGDRLVLSWPGAATPTTGTQTLWRVESGAQRLPNAPWPTTYDLAGPWRWEVSSRNAEGNLTDESEWWELTHRPDGKVDVTYRRRVTTRSSDGTPIACARAPSWSFDDVYVLEGEREETHWHFHELAVEPGDHPCLRTTPRRILDEATAEQIGDFLVLEWRGKRRQVLYREVGAE